LNGKNRTRGEMTATESEPHPGNFPLGSVESRAAARSMIRPGKLRAGDTGNTEEGHYYVVVRDPKTCGLLRVVIALDIPEIFVETLCAGPD
jgi:hypothetical protein